MFVSGRVGLAFYFQLLRVSGSDAGSGLRVQEYFPLGFLRQASDRHLWHTCKSLSSCESLHSSTAGGRLILLAAVIQV